MKHKITLEDLRWKNDITYTVRLQGEDYKRLKQLAGHNCKLTVLKEGGAIPLLQRVKRNIAAVAGAFLLGTLLFYQSMFIAEIQVDGYRSLDEAEIRKTLQDAGVFEGARKQGDYGEAKELLYSTYDALTWVSFYEEGRLLHVDLAEGGDPMENKEEALDVPVDIVASQAGMVQKILPLQGNARCRKGITQIFKGTGKFFLILPHRREFFFFQQPLLFDMFQIVYDTLFFMTHLV